MLNTDELAEKLRVSRKQIQLLAERREIPHYRVGVKLLRFDEAEVMRAISVKADAARDEKSPPEAA
jgi:excisionase family DNA binding protein